MGLCTSGYGKPSLLELPIKLECEYELTGKPVSLSSE